MYFHLADLILYPESLQSAHTKAGGAEIPGPSSTHIVLNIPRKQFELPRAT